MVTPYYDHDGITLYLGDCLEVDAWLAADVLVTDPPYGYGFVSGQARTRRPIAGDHDTAARDAALRAWGTKPAAVFGQWKSPRPQGTRQVLVWDKTDGTGPGMGDLTAAFGSSHEEVYLLGVWERQAAPRRGSVIRTAIAMGNPSGLVARSGHPTPKPVALMETLLLSATPGTVADPFAGSGTTLLAARNLGRRAIGVELEERYCEIAARRLSQGALL